MILICDSSTSRTRALTLSESDAITQDPDSDLEDRMGFVGDRNRPTV